MINREIKFYITRHGETLFNILNRSQGWCDTPLTPKGEADTRMLADGLRNVKFIAAYSSDSGRAVETARIILDGNRYPTELRQDKRLREWCFGSLEGIPNKEFKQTLLQELGTGIEMKALNERLPKIPAVLVRADQTGWAEDFEGIIGRLKAALEEIGEAALEKGGGNVLIISHAFAIKTMIYLFDRSRMAEIEKIRNASITTVIWQDGVFHVEDVNNTGYFEQGGFTSSPSR